MPSKQLTDQLSPDEDVQLTKLFALLLAGFAHFSKQVVTNEKNDAGIYANLLEGFGEKLRQNKSIQKKYDLSALEIFTGVVTGFVVAKSKWYQNQRTVAGSFSILDVLQLTGKEIRHSMVLAWLLDKDIDRNGTHAQGSLGFELFLKALSLPVNYASVNYWVRREVSGNESRVDIEIAARDTFIIHIENKIWSDEGGKQTDREWKDITRRKAALNVPQEHVHCIYLTPDGRSAGNIDFKPLSWYKIEMVLEAFADQAIPDDVRLFARHYARALRAAGISQNPKKENTNDE